MIISKIDGGMGNQMFQYAYGFSLSKKNKTAMAIEHHAYAWRARSYQLDNFNITATVLDFPVAKKNTKISKLVAEIKRRKLLLLNYRTKQVYEDRNGIYSFHREFEELSGENLYLDGFFQSWKYFEWCKDDICKQFSIRESVLSEVANNLIKIVKTENSIAMHIRKGDYPKDWLIPKKYYLDAYKEISARIGKNLKCYIFCENIDYAQEIIDQMENVEVVTGKWELSDFEEFALMSACKYQIISNSTFSWWAAYLNSYEDKLVVAPVFSKWSREYYPDNWICISE